MIGPLKDPKKWIMDYIENNASRIDKRKELLQLLVEKGYSKEWASTLLTETTRDKRILKRPKYVQTVAFNIIRKQGRKRR